MRIIDSLSEMTETARGWLVGGTVGCILLSNTLHEGHRVLIHTARDICETLVVCLLKKTQLPEPSLSTLQQDIDVIDEIHRLSGQNIDVIFLPREQDLYPDTTSTSVTLNGPLADCLRPGLSPDELRMFMTTCTKVFQLVRPDITFFAQKDAYQMAIIRRLISDLNIDMKLHILPTIRESDGLAMSSRNRLLTPTERQAASGLHRGLLKAKTLIDHGEYRATVLQQAITAAIAAAAPQIRLERVCICDFETFVSRTTVVPGTLLVIDAYAGAVPLLDAIAWLPDGLWRI